MPVVQRKNWNDGSGTAFLFDPVLFAALLRLPFQIVRNELNAFLRALTYQLQCALNQGKARSFGFTILKSRSTRNTLTA